VSLLKFLVLSTTAAGSALVLSLFVEPVPSTVHAAPESTAVDAPGATEATGAERAPSARTDETLGARLADQLVRYVGRERSVAALRWLDDELPRRDS
jgi:hypothetical protein